jgi:hypothetical protein
MQRMQVLNPGLDPNHIQIGQQIRRPLGLQNSTRRGQGEQEREPVVALGK